MNWLKSIFDKSVLKVNMPLVNWANETDNIPMLAMWYKLKKEHRNGVMITLHQEGYNYNTLSNWMKELREYGLVEKCTAKGKQAYRFISQRKATKLLTGKKNIKQRLFIMEANRM